MKTRTPSGYYPTTAVAVVATPADPGTLGVSLDGAGAEAAHAAAAAVVHAAGGAVTAGRRMQDTRPAVKQAAFDHCLAIAGRVSVKSSFIVVVAVVVVVVLGVGGCARQQRIDAACEQLVVATCTTREHCGGVDATRCADSKNKRTCTETPEQARDCVRALNDVLAETCAALPPLSSCPQDLLASAPYEACASDDECAAASDALLCLSGSCSVACDARGAACPAQGACNVGDGRCELRCNDFTQPCAPELVCRSDRCLTCDEACVDKECDTGTTCDCGECVATPCSTDDDCPADFGCVDAACAACRRDDAGACVPCADGFDCNDGICVAGGFCV